MTYPDDSDCDDLWFKDPADVKWFDIDWSNYLTDSVTIEAYGIDVDQFLTKVQDAVSGSVVSIQVSGGFSGSQSVVSCSISTSDGNSYYVEKIVYIMSKIL
jgi:hypothetical protein